MSARQHLRCCGGLITYDEVVNKGVIDHAICMATWRETGCSHTANYPSGQSRNVAEWCNSQEESDRLPLMKMGERIQLDPSVDCSQVTYDNFGRIVCKALQEYGMVFCENNSLGYNTLYIENRSKGSNAFGDWSGIIQGDSLESIPINKFRVVRAPCDPNYYGSSACDGLADAQAPSIPVNVKASTISSNQINLTWSASTDNVGVSGYKVYRGSSLITTAIPTNYADTGLTAATPYTYRISVFDEAGNVSGQSTAVTATTLQRYAVAIIKSGEGAGTVSSITPGINCGTTCTWTYDAGSLVTLTALPNATSTFGGWSGGGCAGTDSCTLTINGNASVTATFNILPPPAITDFAGSPVSGSAPFTVNFTDVSSNVSSWLWSFGDGYSSIQKNPSHIYKTPGTYSVLLNVSNGSGSDTLTKTSYITVSSCPNAPIKLARENPQYFSSLQDAYNAAVDGDRIMTHALDFSEDLSLDRNISVSLEGGYDCGYTTSYPSTVISGSLTISDGTVTIENVETF